MSARRDNTGKPMLSFILQFGTTIAGFARVKEIGAIKYDRDNWKKGGKEDHEYTDAAVRHLTAFMEGEVFAQDTGATHLAHCLWNIAALQDLNYPGVTHDPELFESMAEYWKGRRDAEAAGQTFPTVEKWTETRKVSSLPTGTIGETVISKQRHDELARDLEEYKRTLARKEESKLAEQIDELVGGCCQEPLTVELTDIETGEKTTVPAHISCCSTISPETSHRLHERLEEMNDGGGSGRAD